MVSPAALEPVLLLYALIFLLVVRRAVAMARGTPVRPERLVFMAVVYGGLFVLTVGLDFGLLPDWTLAVDAAAIVAGAVLAERHVRDTVVLTPTPAGGWSYRLGVLLPSVYLTLFAVRTVVELVVLNEDPFSTAPLPALSLEGAVALASVTALFALSTGLLVGRTAGVLAAYERRRKETPAPPPPPPATGDAPLASAGR